MGAVGSSMAAGGGVGAVAAASVIAQPCGPSERAAAADAYVPPEGGGGPAAQLAGARQGIIKHGEHVADLVLDIAPGAASGELPGFAQFASFVRQFLQQIEAREISVLNEKFDGSPAIVLGFDGSDRPYVAYKLGIERRGAPRIVRTVKEAAAVYGAGAMREIFEDAIRLLRPRMRAFPGKDLVFQADLLFTPRNGTKAVSDEAVTIRANPFGVVYTLPAGSKFHEFARRAQVGLVVHTVGRRVVDERGEIERVEPLDDAEAVETFVKALRSKDVFAIDPWTRRVRLDEGEERSLTAEKEAEIRRTLSEMQAALEGLSGTFRSSWNYFLPQFRTFLNSSLKQGHSGGLYRAAAADEAFDFDFIAERFRAWLSARSTELRISPKGEKRWMAPKKMPGEFEALLAHHGGALCSYLKAYYDANRILYVLKPHMSAAYASKLGGGRIEGIMITDEETRVKVKLVDRLDFTMQNFAGEGERTNAKRVRRGQRAQARGGKKQEPPPAFLRRWRAGAAFFVGKLQPPHAGHIAMIGAAMRDFRPEEFFVLASNNAPDFGAEHWADLGVAQRKKDLAARDYERVFSRELREEILRYGLPGNVAIGFADTVAFWRYLGKARDGGRAGSVHLIVGAKEMAAGRYAEQLKRFSDQVRLFPVEMQEEGLSATEVRRAVRSLHERGDVGAYEFLVRAFAFVPKKERDRIIGRLLKEWGDVEAAAARLLG